MTTSSPNDGELRILATADLHLGRRPSGLPPSSDHTGLSVSAVWRRLVDLAVDRKVDAVLLAGDVVDAENKFFEALEPLQSGIDELAEHGIDVVAVAGNHDWDVLPRVAETLDSDRFHLLGRGGDWETFTLEREGRPAVDIAGWSFPDRHVVSSPLADGRPEVRGDVPTLGLLHADLDVPDSRYAPVQADELGGADPRHWILGHIHAGGKTELAGGRALYPGSPQPLRPGESGEHGAVMLDLSGTGTLEVERIPTASLRFSDASIDISGVDDDSQLQSHVASELERRHRRHVEDTPELRTVVYTLSLTGRTALHRELTDWIDRLEQQLRLPAVEGVDGHVRTVRLETRPDHDLEQLAEGSDPPALIAECLLALDEDRSTDLPVSELVDDTRRALDEQVYRKNKYRPLRSGDAAEDPPDAEECAHLLRRQGLLLLDELLDQTDR
ncbi:MAG: exonuclease SbcCD subunit D [Bradymonadaceae bacterium]